MDKVPGSGRSTASPRDGARPGDNRGEFRVRVHDHDEHSFEPTPEVPQKPQPFIPRKHRYFPIAVPVIMVGSIVVFIMMMLYNDCPKHIAPGEKCVGEWLKPLSFQPWDENPMLGPRWRAIMKWGGVESSLVTKKKEGWRLLSSIAVNGGVLQLIMNLIALLIVGLRMELYFWFFKVGIIYTMSGFGGNVLSTLFIQNQLFVSASAALLGLIGASFADIFINWDVVERKALKFVDLIVFGLISFGFGLMPQVDNFANVGGLFTGFCLGFVFLLRPQRGYKDTRHLSQLEAFIVNNQDPDLPPVKMHNKRQRVMQLLAGLLLVGLLAAGTVLLFLEVKVNKGCSWCHYAACVPNLKWTCPRLAP
ncbi:RHOMBOID-like protein 2 [Physcomitrium patens]|uniref:RHOMBOID-like protein n=1 Tax=Physcomitrium patens TaxID=3218 RepID=A0A2K1IUL3_PHYPA|nr:RHOMBOID-like protein 2 [Physcomitrium patens]XP_024357010.1 RHOMBOID-like protein 2 [Physcomitrium patens]XP_024357012.1 RHOMBOID-like protein 2 [Physcomitrium patens]XP_024357013.1 RHOMBOID-like protein 2 [Physcomitrium patens]PNR32964.1 hypothetical protein PHYPA_024907 [Physcomitrium patens]|eukprot:XP_024357009.1 RHOMBOID-like protein 2 [Physcomitrella patens]